MAPPKKAIQFLRWFCREDCIEEIEGDLTEVFLKDAQTSLRMARGRFAWSVVKYFRPAFIKSFHNSQPTPDMFQSYFKIGWRNLIRNKGYSAISIGGLAIGMMVATLNGLWIWHEFSYNKTFDNYDRIAQVSEVEWNLKNGGLGRGTTMTYPLTTRLVENYGQHFKRIGRTSNHVGKFLSTNDIAISSYGLYAEESIPAMFSLKMISGSINGLSQTHSILISRSVATALFGDTDPLNKVVRINGKSDVTVTGVFEDLPLNTTLDNVYFFAPWSLYMEENKWIEQSALNDWRNHFLKIYVELPPGPSFDEVTATIKSALQFDPEDLEGKTKSNAELSLYPMSDWHLHPTWQREGQMEPIFMLKLVGAIGVFVLVLACINFVNLSTARAEKRAKEIGIRKTIGSLRGQLLRQFFTESLLVVMLAFALAIVLTVLVLPAFNNIASKIIEIPWSNTWFWILEFGFIITTSIFAGAYPALYLSSFKPIKALKGSLRNGRFASLPRRVLVVFQFSISVMLIVGTIVVYQQIQYAKDRPVGYDRDGLIMINKRSDIYKGKYEVLRNELKNTGVVYEISESMGPVTEIYSGNSGWDWKDRNTEADNNFATLSISHLHGRTVGWQIVQGRDFDINNTTDSSGLIVNESALDMMKLDQPIGEPVSWTWWADKDRVLNYKIIGVVKDMVMESPYTPTEPTIFYLKGHNGNPSWINIKIDPRVSASEALPRIESVFKKIVPSVPFEYNFVDEEYARKFGKEERIGNLAAIFGSLAIFISCLGLLGLASFIAETRTKEIGIRKVLGATISNLWQMLSREFVWLVLIACTIAAPVSYYLMNRWLDKYVYHIDLSIWVFVYTAAGAIIITLLTISYQAISAASANPVKSLKSE